MHKFFLVFALAAALAAPAGAAPACMGHSPAHTVALLELYTSEGCDSCPPADQYFSGLRAGGLAPEQAVLLSLHVDYWNYIGWTDIFSRAVFTERQRDLSSLVGSRTIYTPELFVGGRELRSGRWQSGLMDAVKGVNAKPAQADIVISLLSPSAGKLSVDVKATSAKGGTLHAALVQSGIDSQVKSGENKGRLLHHDFVAREWLAPVALEGKLAKPSAVLSRTLALPAGAQAKQLSVSAFVQDDKGEILQAYNLPLCGS